MSALGRHRRARLALGAALVATGLAGCSRPASIASTPAPSPPPSAKIRFTNITKQAGIDFRHVNGAYGRKLMPETVGSGCAFADFDGDGNLDLVVVNGTNWPGRKTPSGTCRVYRGDGKGGFVDRTKGSGLEKPLYGMGVAVADYDADGRQDLYVTAVGPNRLYRNEGDFRFGDVTAQAGVVGAPTEGVPLQWKWSTGAAWLDYDRDGDLDLFVCQYVKWSPTLDPFCGKNGVRGYCPPDNFEGARCTLFRSNGDGTFADVSREVGLFDAAVGKSFGIGIDDFNRDGYPDILVTNDTWANFLFVNEKGERFSEQGVRSGIAFGENGRARAGMGVDIADVGNDGKPAIVIGNFVNEGLSLFVQEDGDILFTDHAPERGVAAPSLLSVTFATFFFDADLDGWADIFATNGHVDDIANMYRSDISFRQQPLLLQNRGRAPFENVTAEAGLAQDLVGRGAAYGDVNGDGLLDIALVDNAGRFRLLRNDTTGAGRFVRLKLVGAGRNRDALGARVTVTAGGMTQSRYLKSGGSFLSESERTLTFGLGSANAADRVHILWPGGREGDYGPFAAGQTYTISEPTS
ncbi:MAG: CRTAC1 family protein [Capsulimonadales bacterium]|nr:CRTAC1 family protein [Capsulimonadales bacterium]